MYINGIPKLPEIDRSNPLLRGIVGFWASIPGLDGSDKFYDLSGNNLDGTLTNGVTWTDSSIARVPTFDANNDFISINPGGTRLVPPATEFTILGYCKMNSAGSSTADNTIYSSGSAYSLYFSCGGGVPNIYTFQPGYFLSGSNTPISANIWATYAATRSGSTAKVYVNGVPAGTNAGYSGAIFSGTTHYIGRRVDGLTSAPTFNGQISCVMIYHRCLSDDEIAELSRAVLQEYDGLLLEAISRSAIAEHIVIPSGGLEIGGTAAPVKSMIVVASGGINIAGTSMPTIQQNESESSGTETGGTSSSPISDAWKHYCGVTPATYPPPAINLISDASPPSLARGIQTRSIEPSSSGSFVHRDEYGIIYECTWEKLGDQLNIITITKQPRVWGETSQRRVVDGRQLVRGIISTHQQVLELIDSGYVIIGEFFEQIIDYFVEFNPCVSYKTPFAVYNNNYATDRLDITVDGVDVWTDENGVNAWEATDAPTWVDVWSMS